MSVELGLSLALAAGILESPSPGPWERWEATAYSLGCTLPREGLLEPPGGARTASGRWPTPHWTVAAPRELAFDTLLRISYRGIVTSRLVEDRGRSITGKRLDLYMDSCEQSKRWGRREVWVQVWRKPLGGKSSNAKKARKTTDSTRRVSGSRSR